MVLPPNVTVRTVAIVSAPVYLKDKDGKDLIPNTPLIDVYSSTGHQRVHAQLPKNQTSYNPLTSTANAISALTYAIKNHSLKNEDGTVTISMPSPNCLAYAWFLLSGEMCPDLNSECQLEKMQPYLPAGVAIGVEYKNTTVGHAYVICYLNSSINYLDLEKLATKKGDVIRFDLHTQTFKMYIGANLDSNTAQALIDSGVAVEATAECLSNLSHFSQNGGHTHPRRCVDSMSARAFNSLLA